MCTDNYADVVRNDNVVIPYFPVFVLFACCKSRVVFILAAIHGQRVWFLSNKQNISNILLIRLYYWYVRLIVSCRFCDVGYVMVNWSSLQNIYVHLFLWACRMFDCSELIAINSIQLDKHVSTYLQIWRKAYTFSSYISSLFFFYLSVYLTYASPCTPITRLYHNYIHYSQKKNLTEKTNNPSYVQVGAMQLTSKTRMLEVAVYIKLSNTDYNIWCNKQKTGIVWRVSFSLVYHYLQDTSSMVHTSWHL